MTNIQKEFCRKMLEEFLNTVSQITKKDAIQCVRVDDAVDHRKKDQKFTIKVYFRSTSKKYWLTSH